MTDVPKDYAPGDDPQNEGTAGKVGANAAETAAQLQRAVQERAEEARRWAADQTEVIRGQVVERPFAAVGVSAGAAFAAGVIVGVLLARS